MYHEHRKDQFLRWLTLLLMRPDSELQIVIFDLKKQSVFLCSPIVQNPNKILFENPMAQAVRFWPKICRLGPSDYQFEK